ncbi:MAG: 3-hydroxyacyl-CoA dehydrogenase, partial [Verrucomicrobia bacterium]|nr:3-hydroxyacyl-CoA dehydrogenase [Verrucomicrobiota bacterium]
MLDIRSSDLVAGVAGSGTMGRGIVQVLAQCGVRTLVFDSKPGAARSAKASIAQALAKLAEKGRVTQAEIETTLGRIEVVDALHEFEPAHIVVEAILEQLEAKRDLFRALEGVVGADTILASNTSSLSVTAMAAACKRPQRVAGYHFFNPVPVMKIVEVVAGELTEPWVTEALTELAKRFGHTPVRCKDTPGFIVNHAGRGFVPESLRVLSEGIADFATIDRILVDAAGFRIGPFGLMDLVGLDVNHSVQQSLYAQYFDEPKYRPFYLLEPRVAAGLLGRKTGRGWYAYGKDGQAERIPEPAVPAQRANRVWVAPNAASLKDLLGKLGAEIESGAKPSDEAVCFVAPLGQDATTTALQLLIDPQRTVAVDPIFGFAKRRTL